MLRNDGYSLSWINGKFMAAISVSFLSVVFAAAAFTIPGGAGDVKKRREGVVK